MQSEISKHRSIAALFRFVAFSFVCLAACSASGATYYVSTSGKSTAAGTAADPYDIATGFAKASGGAKHEVVVMPGTYKLTATLAARGGGSVVCGSTGNPADVVLDAGGEFPVMCLEDEILVHSLTIANGTTNPATAGNAGILAGGVRLGVDNNSYTGSSVVSNCVISGCYNSDAASFLLGAVVMYRNSKLLDSVIEGNTAKYAGAGVNIAENGAVVRGCTFRNNRAENGTANTHGGAFLMGKANLTVLVEDCVFENNWSRSAGAAFLSRASGAGATFRRCKFLDNTSGYGAAISTFANNQIFIEDCEFSGNKATSNGGAIRLYGGSVATIDGSTFSGNTAVRGGAVVVNGASRLVTDGTTFDGNSATDTSDPTNTGGKTMGGGAVACDSLAAASGVWGGVWLTNTVFSANSAKSYGGALSNTGGMPMIGEIFNCKFIGNSAVVYGGAVFFCEQKAGVTVGTLTVPARGDAAPFLIRQTLFAENSVVDQYTAGIGNEKKNVSNGGAIYFVSYQNPVIDSCTITGNSATSSASSQGRGGAMYHKWGGTLCNTIIANNPDTKNKGQLTTDSMLNASAYTYCCAYPAAATLFTEANHNIVADPLFANADEGDYRLQDSSPCKGMGLNEDWMAAARDLAGLRHRIYGETVDIGAYEIFIPSAFVMCVR